MKKLISCFVLLLRQENMSKVVMPDLIRHPALSWIPAFAGMTVWPFIVAGVITAISLLPGNVLWAFDNDVKEIPACKYCGMNRETFAHSRMLIEYDDGTIVGTCSLHCVSVDLALNLDKTPKAIQVGDYGRKGLINAETATWIIGGK